MCSPFSIDIRPRRLPAEIKQIEESSNDHGIHCYIQNDSYESLEAVIPGPKETPYEEIQFKIAMEFDSHYPFRPPSAKFITPVYHPNIDTDGKICLDVLRMPPGGSYNPAITLESILLSIQLLLASPNPDDPLRDDVSDEYRYNRELFNQNAKKFSGFDETAAGNSSKKMKIDGHDMTTTTSKTMTTTTTSTTHNNLDTISDADDADDDDDNDNDDDDDSSDISEQKPNTSDESGSATERVSVSSKPNRKRKHNET